MEERRGGLLADTEDSQWQADGSGSDGSDGDGDEDEDDNTEAHVTADGRAVEYLCGDDSSTDKSSDLDDDARSGVHVEEIPTGWRRLFCCCGGKGRGSGYATLAS